MATVAVERVAMGWRRDAEGTSKGRRVPLTRRNDLHDAEGTSKGLSLDAKGVSVIKERGRAHEGVTRRWPMGAGGALHSSRHFSVHWRSECKIGRAHV